MGDESYIWHDGHKSDDKLQIILILILTMIW